MNNDHLWHFDDSCFVSPMVVSDKRVSWKHLDFEKIQKLSHSDFVALMRTQDQLRSVIFSPAVLLQITSRDGVAQRTVCAYDYPGAVNNHQDIISNANYELGNLNQVEENTRGYITSTGHFLTRKQAYHFYEEFLYEVVKPVDEEAAQAGFKGLSHYPMSHEINWKLLTSHMRNERRKNADASLSE